MNWHWYKPCSNPQCAKNIAELIEYASNLEEQLKLRNTPPSPPASVLEVIQWAPEDSVFDHHEQCNEADNGSGPSHTAVGNFIDRIPKDERQWEQKRKNLGISNADGILTALSTILSPRQQAGTKEPSLAYTHLQIRDYLANRAVEAGQAAADAQRAVALSSFGSLVFFGECCVALELGMKMEDVDNSMREFLSRIRSASCKATSKTLQMYRDVAIWVTQQMHLLYDDFYHRGFEMFLYAEMTVSTYDSLARSKFRKSFHREIKTKIKPPDALQAEIQAALPLYLPFFVWANLRRRLGVDHYDKVCDAMQARYFSKSHFETWYQRMEQPEETGLAACAPPTPNPGGSRFPKRQRRQFPTDHPTAKRRRPHTDNRNAPVLERETRSHEESPSIRRASISSRYEGVSGQASPDDRINCGAEDSCFSAPSRSDADTVPRIEYAQTEQSLPSTVEGTSIAEPDSTLPQMEPSPQQSCVETRDQRWNSATGAADPLANERDNQVTYRHVPRQDDALRPDATRADSPSHDLEHAMVQQQSMCPDIPVDEGASTSFLDKPGSKEIPSGNEDRATTSLGEICVHPSINESFSCYHCGTSRCIHALVSAVCATDALGDSSCGRMIDLPGQAHSAIERIGEGQAQDADRYPLESETRFDREDLFGAMEAASHFESERDGVPLDTFGLENSESFGFDDFIDYPGEDSPSV